MKKKLLCLFAIALCLAVVGCGKKEEKSKEWSYDVNVTSEMLDEDLEKIFKDGTKDYKGTPLSPVALLSTQLVAGRNYMFLGYSKTNDKVDYKVVILYKDLQGNVKMTSTSDFDVTKYANIDKQLNTEELVGAWTTEVPGKPIVLESKVQEAFDEATGKLMGASYYPITIVAKKEDSGTNYAILCYGRLTDQNATTGIFVITLNVNEDNKADIKSISAVDLTEFNK